MYVRGGAGAEGSPDECPEHTRDVHELQGPVLSVPEEDQQVTNDQEQEEDLEKVK